MIANTRPETEYRLGVCRDTNNMVPVVISTELIRNFVRSSV